MFLYQQIVHVDSNINWMEKGVTINEIPSRLLVLVDIWYLNYSDMDRYSFSKHSYLF